MIHTASLIHDDVLDDSDMRRGMICALKGKLMETKRVICYKSWLVPLYVIVLVLWQVIKDFASGKIKQAASLFDFDVKL